MHVFHCIGFYKGFFDYERGCLAERQGFEPWEGFPSTVFKTAAIDHSAISPRRIL